MLLRNRAHLAHYIKSGFSLLFDATMGGIILFVSALMVSDIYITSVRGKILASLLFAIAIIAVFYVLKIHTWIWRFTSRENIWSLAGAIIVTFLVYLPAAWYFSQKDMLPLAAVIIAVPLLILALCAARLFYQAHKAGEFAALSQGYSPRAIPGILFGSAESCAKLARQIRSAEVKDFRLLGAIVTDDAIAGQSLSGITVLGHFHELDGILERQAQLTEKALRLIIADNIEQQEQVADLIRATSRHNAVVRRFVDHTGRLAQVDPSILLARPKRDLDQSRSRKLIEGKRILVTGAGGTIGSELVRQILPFDPHSICLFDSSEYNLFEIEQELDSNAIDESRRISFLGDIRDAARVEEAFAAFKPEIVLHAAALKHVPLMECNATEAILTNIFGTQIVAKASKRHEVDAFVFISTDKAVDPTNVMGTTKRASELIIRQISKTAAGSYSLVRFGNVLGSAGSVVPLFEQQIEQGGPVTVTHEEVERFFMTVEEAAALVLQAASLTQKNEDGAALYVLDMGGAVKIKDLARQLIRLKGLEPDHDIEVIYTGLRAGEKLKENLIYNDEQISERAADGILTLKMNDSESDLAETLIEKIIKHAQRRDTAAARRALARLSPTLVNNAQ